jgi:hypothetical protein
MYIQKQNEHRGRKLKLQWPMQTHSENEVNLKNWVNNITALRRYDIVVLKKCQVK